MKSPTSTILLYILNSVDFFLLKEYNPKVVATALQLVVLAPRNKQEM